MHLISYIHGIPSRRLYCKAPSIIWNKICKVLRPTLRGKIIVPIVVEKVSLKALSCKVEEDRLLWDMLRGFKDEDDITSWL